MNDVLPEFLFATELISPFERFAFRRGSGRRFPNQGGAVSELPFLCSAEDAAQFSLWQRLRTLPQARSQTHSCCSKTFNHPRYSSTPLPLLSFFFFSLVFVS